MKQSTLAEQSAFIIEQGGLFDSGGISFNYSPKFRAFQINFFNTSEISLCNLSEYM